MINDIKWVQAQREATDWRQAVEIATRPLVAYGAAQPCYVNGIIENTLNWGPYYLIAPGIALPHARPEQGANYNQVSITTLRTPVAFGNEECDRLAASLRQRHRCQRTYFDHSAHQPVY